MKRNIQFVLSALAAVLLFSCSSLSVPPVPRAPGPAQPPYFRNLSEKLGLDDFAAKRATFVDADSDGWLDLFLLGSGEDGMRLFLSRPGSDGDRGLEHQLEPA